MIISTVFVVDFHHNHSAMVISRNPCPRPLVVVSSVDPPMCTSTQCLLKYATYYYSSCSPVIRHPGFNSQWLLAFNYFTSYNDTHVTQQTKKSGNSMISSQSKQGGFLCSTRLCPNFCMGGSAIEYFNTQKLVCNCKISHCLSYHHIFCRGGLLH